jgi:hypothetical protein
MHILTLTHSHVTFLYNVHSFVYAILLYEFLFSVPSTCIVLTSVFLYVHLVNPLMGVISCYFKPSFSTAQGTVFLRSHISLIYFTIPLRFQL